jgi:ATP/maltotriose-dependent transcriptional regulator MalT
LGETLSTAGRDEEAVQLLLESLAAAREAGLHGDAARLRGTALVLANALPGTRRIIRPELATAISDALENPGADPVLLAHAAIEHAVAIGPASVASELATRALQMGLVDLVTADAPPPYLATGALWVSGHYAEAERSLDEALDESRSRGSAVGYALASSFRSAARVRRGDLAGAQTDAEAGLEFGLGGGWTPVGLPVAASSLLTVLRERGELAAASGLAAQLSQADIPPGLILNQPLRLSLAELELARSEPAAALRILGSIEDWESDWGGQTGAWCPWRSRAALAHRALGEADRAAELASDELALARAFGAAPYLGSALRIAAETSQSEAELRVHLEESVEVLRESEARLELAKARLALGAAIRRDGRDREAREHLAAAQKAAAACGATAIDRQILDELVAAGGRPRARASADRDRLTPAELRVATLAANGSANREIAQSLFVTLKTVETHLSRVYRKLEISSRAQLPGRLEKEALDEPRALA